MESDDFFGEVTQATPVETQDKKMRKISDSREMTNIEVRRPALVESILKNICKRDAFICGGFARVACSPKQNPFPTSDIDIYLLDEEFLERLIYRIEQARYIRVKENDVAYVYSYALEGDDRLQLNIIKPIHSGHLHTFGDIDEILQNFDFSIARVGIYLNESGEIVGRGDVDFLEDEKAGYLNIKNIHCPIAEISRISKYQAKGYKCPLIMILRCFMDWDDRDDDFRRELVAALTSESPLSKSDEQKLYERLYVD